MRGPGAARSLALVISALALIGCRSASNIGSGTRARTMVLTSGPTEIVMSSSKVPGYWAREVFPSLRRDVSGGEFYLYTSNSSFGKGDRVVVEGPFGLASPAVLRDETGEYVRWYSVYVLAVWKIRKET